MGSPGVDARLLSAAIACLLHRLAHLMAHMQHCHHNCTPDALARVPHGLRATKIARLLLCLAYLMDCMRRCLYNSTPAALAYAPHCQPCAGHICLPVHQPHTIPQPPPHGLPSPSLTAFDLP
eukprot:scaffold20243_cov22-Tisochrysis_lutea.AAC.1